MASLPRNNTDNAGYYRFTAPARIDREINTLCGLLKGMSFDGTRNVESVHALQAWADNCRDLHHRHPFDEIVAMIDKATDDLILEEDEAADILWLCERLSPEGGYYARATADMQELQGVLAGILADGVVTMDELRSLRGWMDEHGHLRSCWPYDEIDNLLVEVTRDGKIDDREHALLKVYFGEFMSRPGHRAVAMPLNELDVPISGLCAVCPEVYFPQKCFTFTGSFESKTRHQLVDMVELKGGSFSPNVTHATDYLVIGAKGNPCWAFSCYGRKVEKAVEYRKKGLPLLIVHENDFWDAAT
jgi:hypothetical protein